MGNVKVWLRKVFNKGAPARKTAGVLLIIFGAVALVTPFTPGAGLIMVGLGLFGIHISFWSRLKAWFARLKQ